MFWDIVYNFFIQHIFGGFDTFGNGYTSSLGIGFYNNNGTDITDDFLTTDAWLINLNGAFQYDGDYYSNFYMPIGNYLSLIATIISMVAIVVLCCLFIKKIYNMCAHIIG